MCDCIGGIHVGATLKLFYVMLLTLPLREGYSKWLGKISVCVSDPAVPQELDTPGLPYLACIHSSEVARTSTH